jgi:outer membrane protein assembly factor BamD
VRAFVVYAENSIASKQEERYQKAVENYDRLVQVFPDSKLVQRAADLYKEAQDALDEIRAEKDAQPVAESGNGASGK